MSEKQPIVTIQDGQLQGCIKIDWRGKQFYSFQGIPYAKPPLGKLRFKAPQPVEPWSGVRDATKEGNDCYSRHFMFQKFMGSEDCLFLNVYTPQLPKEGISLKPVMVWVHGGGFINGSGSTEAYGPEFLVSEDIVLVTINYRLGLLGFAVFDDPALEIPGNAGLKDQVLALKWVQKHISAFGGDPKNVTIFGESAGGVSVHLLGLSPLAKGLFHRVIVQSGVGISDWARGRQTAPLAAKVLGLENVSEPEIATILTELPIDKLLELQEKLPDKPTASQLRSIGPVVESVKNETAFLIEEPLQTLLFGRYSHVPMMFGYTSREGILVEFVQKMKYGEIKWVNNFEDLIPYGLKISPGTELSKAVAEKIKRIYYGDETPSNENIDQFYLLHTDIMFFIDTNNAVREHTKSSTSPVYYYRMSLDTNLNMFKKIASLKRPGTSHGDDLGYLFKNALTPEIRPNSNEDIGLRRFLKLWTNFAKTGDPNPIEKTSLINITWPRTEENKLYFLEIGENLTVGINPDTVRAELWDEIFQMCRSTSKL